MTKLVLLWPDPCCLLKELGQFWSIPVQAISLRAQLDTRRTAMLKSLRNKRMLKSGFKSTDDFGWSDRCHESRFVNNRKYHTYRCRVSQLLLWC